MGQPPATPTAQPKAETPAPPVAALPAVKARRSLDPELAKFTRSLRDAYLAEVNDPAGSERLLPSPSAYAPGRLPGVRQRALAA